MIIECRSAAADSFKKFIQCYKKYAPLELNGNTQNDRKLLDNSIVMYFSSRGATFL